MYRRTGLMVLFVLAGLLFVNAGTFQAHAVGGNYKLTMSASRVQETNNPGVTLVLNVTNALVGQTYQFAWHVTDPSSTVHNANSQVSAAPQTFTTSVNFPTSFSTSIIYVGNYTVRVDQTLPISNSSIAVGQFQVGLTNSTTYQRTLSVALKAQGYQSLENVTITVANKSGTLPGFPTFKLADTAGALSFVWASIPASTPLGNSTVTLIGKTTLKSHPDIQSFAIAPANVTISQLSIMLSSIQRTQVQSFHFTASYPNGAQVRTGSATIRVAEEDGITFHYVIASYKTLFGFFQGSYQIPLASQDGVWVASIEVSSFDDGYGNRGPITSVPRGFAVSPASLTVFPLTTNATYTVGSVVAIYASVLTPSGDNFTSGVVTATTYYSARQIGNPIQLSFDQSRGKWVGSYIVNATNPPGIWIISVNATDPYGNTGQGSTSTLVTIPPPPPQQSPTSNYLLVLVAVLLGALAILSSWVFYRRRRIVNRVLKVDIQAIHAEAQKVENQDFFKKIQEQLKQQKKESGSSGS